MPKHGTAEVISALRSAFAAHANPGLASPMQAYMKSTLPFYGIPAPLRRRLTSATMKTHPVSDTATLARTMLALWRGARFREERSAALDIARIGRRSRAPACSLAMLPVLEEMITSGAWWDFVDDISGDALATLLQAYPRELKPLLRRWARGNDLWLRRAAILCQRKLGPGDFDAELLYDMILPSIGQGRFADEFFIRKGIGWALRERSYAAPDEVAAFCREYASALSPLTRREALRVIAKRAAVKPESE
jgi:3-methyladenine DNA glycosylase AlkD